MGCLRRLGCLVALLAVLAAAWVTRDRWRPWLPSWVPGHGAVRTAGTPSAADAVWAPVTAAGATRAENAARSLGDRKAAVFASILPADFAAFMLMDLAGRLPPDSDVTEAAVVGNQLALRSSVELQTLTGGNTPRLVAATVGPRLSVAMGGTFDVVRSGVAEYRVQSLTIHGVPVPGALIPQVIRKIEVGAHPAGLAANALLVNVPPYVADIRATRGRITLYKNEP